MSENEVENINAVRDPSKALQVVLCSVKKVEKHKASRWCNACGPGERVSFEIGTFVERRSRRIKTE